MQLTLFDLLPAVESEPTCDWTTMVYHGTDKHGKDHPSIVLIYAVRRDYLSVPKTYAVTEFFGNESCLLEVHQMSCESYLDEIDISAVQPKSGLYELEASEDSRIALLIDNTTVLEIVYGSLLQHKEIYYSADSKSALSEYIKQS